VDGVARGRHGARAPGSGRSSRRGATLLLMLPSDLNSEAALRMARDSMGCCHAHSNCIRCKGPAADVVAGGARDAELVGGARNAEQGAGGGRGRRGARRAAARPPGHVLLLLTIDDGGCGLAMGR